eukprot:SAG11_NODE_8825_length_972_cov_2.394044_1_plen_29_part_01
MISMSSEKPTTSSLLASSGVRIQVFNRLA